MGIEFRPFLLLCEIKRMDEKIASSIASAMALPVRAERKGRYKAMLLMVDARKKPDGGGGSLNMA